MTAKLPVMGTLRDAVELTVSHRRELLRVGLVFIAGFFAVGIVAINFLLPLFTGSMLGAAGDAAQSAADPRLAPGLLLMLVIEILLFSVFATGWHRVVLIGAERAGRGLGAQLGWRELRYFGRLWLCIAISIGIVFVIAFVELFIGMAVGANPRALMWGAELAYMLTAAYVFARLGPSFAALSIDSPLTFLQSWTATRGNGLRILFVYLQVGIGWLLLNVLLSQIAGLFGLDEIAPYTLLLVGDLTLCALFALIISINAIVFRQLTGWKAPA